MSSEKDLLQKELTDLEAQKDVQGLEQLAEDAATLGHEDIAAQAQESINKINAFADSMGETNPVHAAHIEHLGGSTEELGGRTAEVDKKIDSVKNDAEAKIKLIQSGDELEANSEDFRAEQEMSVEKRQYMERAKLLREENRKRQEKVEAERGKVSVDSEEIAIETFVKDPNAIDQLDFNRKQNLANIDLLLEAGVPPERIYTKMTEALGKPRALEKVMLLPKEARNKMYAMTEEDSRQFKNTAKELGATYLTRAQRNNGDSKFTEMVMFMGMPLTQRERNSISDTYVKDALTAKENFKQKFEIAKENGTFKSIDMAALCSKPTELSALFRTTEVKYLTREEVISIVQETLKSVTNGPQRLFEENIINSVLALENSGQITHEEANAILEAPAQ